MSSILLKNFTLYIRAGHYKEDFRIGQNVFHVTPLEQICSSNIFEVGLQTRTLPMGKAKNIKILNFVFAML